ncbi:MAG: hypothetical protein KTR24_09140 [Saprospiraceae bacterium]|nr:hypothetical protein [Saprospiraceae bacterium]
MLPQEKLVLPPENSRLAIGCVAAGPMDWLKVDVRATRHVDYVVDIMEDWQFRDLTHVYVEQYLQKLSLSESLLLLHRISSSLQKDGFLRITSANIEWVLKTHYNYASFADGVTALNSVASVNRAFRGWGHKFLFSAPLLKWILTQLGFSHIEQRFDANCRFPELSTEWLRKRFTIKDGTPNLIILEAKKDKDVDYPSDLAEQLYETYDQYIKR